jgi:hypothetical protein
MRYIVVGLIVALGLALVSACGPSTRRHVDEWGEDTMKKPEITGDNEQDEARWRRELASDPWGDDANLLTDDPPKTAAEYDDDDAPPLDFVGPPEPPSRWDTMQKGGTKFGKVMFSIMTVLVTLGMMAAPYLMMI